MSENLCPVKNFIRPDKPHGCTYSPTDKTAVSPHNHVTKKSRDSNDTCGNILDMIGNTPLVHLKNISADNGIKCNLYAKCEYMNSGGSIKDRIGVRMVEEAEKSGQLKPGDYVIEPTSGNTGIGLALACAVKGYKCIIVMPEKMSKEKNDVLKALGATIIRTPTSAAFDAPNSHISEAQRIMERLNAEKAGCAHILDQYTNPYNPIAHYDGTATEIVAQLKHKVDYIVATAGTGGTICGIARKIKEECPDAIIIGVDPIGSLLAQPNEINDFEGSGFYDVEGIGYDFIPTVLDRSQIDSWYKSEDKKSFQTARQLIKREGLLCGGSSGSAVYCALDAIKKYNIGEGKNVVVILPDSVRNYMTKYLSDEWMTTRGFFEVEKSSSDPWWFHKEISSLGEHVRPIGDNIISEDESCTKAIELMKKNSTDCLLTITNGKLANVVTKKNIMAKLVNGSVSPSDSIKKAFLDRFLVLQTTDKLRKLQCSLDSEGYAIVVKGDGAQINTTNISKESLFAVITVDSLLSYITANNN